MRDAENTGTEEAGLEHTGPDKVSGLTVELYATGIVRLYIARVKWRHSNS